MPAVIDLIGETVIFAPDLIGVMISSTVYNVYKKVNPQKALRHFLELIKLAETKETPRLLPGETIPNKIWSCQ